MFPDKSVRQAQIYSPSPKLPLLLRSHCAKDLQHSCKNTLLFFKNHCKCLVGWKTHLHWPSGKTIKYLALVGVQHLVHSAITKINKQQSNWVAISGAELTSSIHLTERMGNNYSKNWEVKSQWNGNASGQSMRKWVDLKNALLGGGEGISEWERNHHDRILPIFRRKGRGILDQIPILLSWYLFTNSLRWSLINTLTNLLYTSQRMIKASEQNQER